MRGLFCVGKGISGNSAGKTLTSVPSMRNLVCEKALDDFRHGRNASKDSFGSSGSEPLDLKNTRSDLLIFIYIYSNKLPEIINLPSN